MKLAELTLAKLEEIDLNGVLVKKLLVETDEIIASFEINGIEIEFVIDNDGQAHTTALILNNQTYTDAETLTKCTSWVDYVATVVKKVMSEQQASIEESAKAKELEKSTQFILPVVPEFKIETMPEVPAMVIDNENEEYESEKVEDETKSIPKQPPPLKTNANAAEGDLSQNHRIAEAFERGRREGYTESHKINLTEVKKVRRRATIFIIILFLLFVAVFGAVYILFGEYAGFYVPELLQFFNNNGTNVPPTIELY